MSTIRDKKLNRSDVRIAIWKFILSFVVLSLISFCAIFFFFKSYHTQRIGMEAKAEQYSQLLGRSAALNIKVDSIHTLMTLLDINKVQNDIVLSRQITGELYDARSIMGADSVDNLKHYAVLLKHIEPMIDLKSKIISVANKKEYFKTQYERCKGKNATVVRELRIDPTRKYAGRRR
ncbi:type VI secretion system TssO [Chryseobacterium wangxinyae]|uniref:type VI secretion system TssO n=1 Tax=unclassified Chryseobacterium TaxID=2593645 RepID=UPI00226E90B3|nr:MULTISPECIES: type VI secretion system TssO [unclassified Chryseobacterium]MCY0967703.1 type VI secretion system TssO [Chryseobacterium sp. CY353]MCY0978057.1 type VI secretion system TssO [Chryseobacterium sp. CY350]WBZ95144.1 type VI secretion system TssO [Chryseobacterium sp. CY350]